MLRLVGSRIRQVRSKVKYATIKERPKKVEKIGGNQQMKDTTLMKEQSFLIYVRNFLGNVFHLKKDLNFDDKSK